MGPGFQSPRNRAPGDAAPCALRQAQRQCRTWTPPPAAPGSGTLKEAEYVPARSMNSGHLLEPERARQLLTRLRL